MSWVLGIAQHNVLLKRFNLWNKFFGGTKSNTQKPQIKFPTKNTQKTPNIYDHFMCTLQLEQFITLSPRVYLLHLYKCFRWVTLNFRLLTVQVMQMVICLWILLLYPRHNIWSKSKTMSTLATLIPFYSIIHSYVLARPYKFQLWMQSVTLVLRLNAMVEIRKVSFGHGPNGWLVVS